MWRVEPNSEFLLGELYPRSGDRGCAGVLSRTQQKQSIILYVHVTYKMIGCTLPEIDQANLFGRWDNLIISMLCSEA